MSTLHKAIEIVLSEVAPGGLSVAEIARIIRQRALYRQQNGGSLTLQQTYARIRNYESLFEVEKSVSPAVIRLRQGTSPRPAPTRPTIPQPEDDAWPWEGNIQARIRADLEAHGWKILKEANTRGRGRSVDLLARKGRQTRAIEVKGYPSTVYARGEKRGEPKPTKPSLQARHWYAQALLAAVLRQTAFPNADVFLGLPNVPRYRTLLESTRHALQRLGLCVYMVPENGRVFEYHPTS